MMRALQRMKSASDETRTLLYQLLFIAFALGFPFGLATSPIIFRDGDTSWQVAAGQWILRNGRIPTADPFSFTAAGHPWVAMEWGAEVIYASAFRAAGYAGLAAIVAASLIALNAIIFFYLQRRTSPVIVGATLLMMNIVLGPFMLARPHVLAWPVLAGWTVLLLDAAEEGHAPPLWSAAILLVWTNLHASFPLALLIAAAIGLDALIKARWATLRQWILFGIVSVVALLLNANGIAGLLQPFRTASLSMLPLISEWHPSNTESTPFFFVVLLIGIGAALRSGTRVPLGRLLLLLVMLGMAFAHVRHQSTFIIVAACVLPPLLRAAPARNRVPKSLLFGALPLLAFRIFSPLMPPETPANPQRLIEAVPAQLRAQPVFNAYTFGGPLILAGIKPYIDGRAEIYGDSFVRDYVDMTHGDVAAFDRTVQKYDIRWAMLLKDDKPLIDGIERTGKWRRIYEDDVGVIDVRLA
jgi:hypothetical protein